MIGTPSTREIVQRTKENKRDIMYDRIEKHGENLNAIFHTGIGNVPLCKKLFRLERVLHKAAEDYCNVENFDIEAVKSQVMPKVDAILKYSQAGIPVFFNQDPRGYALKIQDSWMKAHPNFRLEKDWGGYGLIAPDLKE